MWEILNFGEKIHAAAWPVWDDAKTVDDVIEIPVQINGKVRGKVTVPAEATQDDVKAKLKEDEKLYSLVDGKNIVKEIYVPGKIFNIVVK
jgi:leucyl-tRNA synthetase